jgi:hypothetical protein
VGFFLVNMRRSTERGWDELEAVLSLACVTFVDKPRCSTCPLVLTFSSVIQAIISLASFLPHPSIAVVRDHRVTRPYCIRVSHI